jgi:hypothetical protein
MKRILTGAVLALGAAMAVLAAPAAQAAAPAPGNWPLWPLCGTLSLFSDDECAAIKHCLNTDDPACQQAGSQPSTPPQQSGGYYTQGQAIPSGRPTTHPDIEAGGIIDRIERDLPMSDNAAIEVKLYAEHELGC